MNTFEIKIINPNRLGFKLIKIDRIQATHHTAFFFISVPSRGAYSLLPPWRVLWNFRTECGKYYVLLIIFVVFLF